MIDIFKVSPTKHNRSSSKHSDGQPVGIQSEGHSREKQAKQLEVAQRPVCNRVKKVGARAKCKGGAVPKSEKVGSEAFKCMSCTLVKPSRQRRGKLCCDCTHKRYVSSSEGALRCRYTQKKSVARRKGILFTL